MYKSTFFTLEVLEPPESDDDVDVRDKFEAEFTDSSVDERERLLQLLTSADAKERLQEVLTVSVLDVRPSVNRGRHAVALRTTSLSSESEVRVLDVSVLDVRSIMQRGRHGVLATSLLSRSEG